MLTYQVDFEIIGLPNKQTANNQKVTIMEYQLDSISFEAYNQGVESGVITDTEQEVIAIILEQEVVSYCGKRFQVTFDTMDLIEV